MCSNSGYKSDVNANHVSEVSVNNATEVQEFLKPYVCISYEYDDPIEDLMNEVDCEDWKNEQTVELLALECMFH